MEDLCSAKMELLKNELIHRFEKDEMDEQHSREENEAEHAQLRASGERAHKRIDDLKALIEWAQAQIKILQGAEDAAIVSRVKGVSGFLKKQGGIIIGMLLLAAAAYFLGLMGIKI